MPSYAGAKAAIETYLRDRWSSTSIAVLNPTPAQSAAVVTKNNQGDDIPWAFLRIEDAGSTQRTFSAPGDNLFVYDGLISVEVFVPVGTGLALGAQYADQIGEIFRNREFYREAPGFCVRTWAPRVESGDSASDDGLWFRVGAIVPFEYWHRG